VGLFWRLFLTVQIPLLLENFAKLNRIATGLLIEANLEPMIAAPRRQRGVRHLP
jgi:hypothetical protein